jgi:hypothetical protein
MAPVINGGIGLPARGASMSGVVNLKPKAIGTFTIENGELLDFDAYLAQGGLNRATIDALFADHVKNEEEAPEVVHQRKLLELYREHVAQLREAAALKRTSTAARSMGSAIWKLRSPWRKLSISRRLCAKRRRSWMAMIQRGSRRVNGKAADCETDGRVGAAQPDAAPSKRAHAAERRRAAAMAGTVRGEGASSPD